MADRFRDCQGIQITRQLKKLHDLFDLMLKRMDILLIFYSFNLNEEIRAAHSFPSKFTEFCHLGIPILIIAPAESAIGRWATDHQWLCYVNGDSKESILTIIARLQSPTFWKECSTQSLDFAVVNSTQHLFISDYLP
jgi:hypothetical protein